MSHVSEVIAYQRLSNGQFAVTIRCCGQPSTDWNHTMAAEVAGDAEKRGGSINEARRLCAELHEQAEAAHEALMDEVGAKVTHE